MKIADIHARQILDSRGNPTVEADVRLEDGSLGRAAVPSGASTGSNEALELRDGGQPFGGKGVLKAVSNINLEISEHLKDSDSDQSVVDLALVKLDGTETKSRLGANAILAVSLAVAKANAAAKKQLLFEHIKEIAGVEKIMLPVPMMNVMNGGAHASWSTDIQEYMIVPAGADSFEHAVQMGSEIFHALGKILKDAGYPTTVGDEGGYAPKMPGGNEEPLKMISQAVETAGYTLGSDILLALDPAASEFYKDEKYELRADKKSLTGSEMIDWLTELTNRYPIVSIEDGLAENDWTNWTTFTKKAGDTLQIVGDDLFVTNAKFLQKGIDLGAANAILIKLNQIGTLTETIGAVQLAQSAGYRPVISHRSGETEDTTIAHLAVGLGAGQIKTGSLSRTDRVAKYNELLRIEEVLGSKADYPGQTIFVRRK